MIIPLVTRRLTSSDLYLRLIGHFKPLFEMIFTLSHYLILICHFIPLFKIRFSPSSLLRKRIYYRPLNEVFPIKINFVRRDFPSGMIGHFSILQHETLKDEI